MKHIPRFYTTSKIVSSEDLFLSSDQMFHANKVLRLKEGDIVRVFNNNYGEWDCSIKNVKRNIVVPTILIEKPREEIGPAIACALIHQNKFSLMLEKITELGVQEIYPIVTSYTQYKTFNKQKMQQIIIHACEQSKRLTVPKIYEVTPLQDFVDKVSQNRKILVGLENKNASNIMQCLVRDSVFVIGPEGGFSDLEIEYFKKFSSVDTFYFGQNILRSETAAIAFSSIWVSKFL